MRLLLPHCAGCWLALVLGANLQAAPVIVNGFAAIVNDKVITIEDVAQAVRQTDVEAARLRYGANPRAYDQEVARLRQDALLGLIERELILSEFKTAGYQLPPNALDEQLKDRIREDYGGNRTTLIKTLQAQNITVETYKERMRERFIVEALTRQNINSAILISPYKIERYYREHLDQFELKDRIKLRMISLWHKADRGPEATRQLADHLAEQLKNGVSFTDLATLHSDDPQRRDGGDRGWIEREGTELRSDLQTYAFSLTPGTPSEVLETAEGCYLMLVEEAQQAHTRPLIEVRDSIEAILQQEERARLREEWISRLREKSFVRFFPMK